MEEVIPMEIAGTGPLKESINNFFANAVKKYAPMHEIVRFATKVLTSTDPKIRNLSIIDKTRNRNAINKEKLRELQEQTDRIIRETIQESHLDKTLEDSPKIMKYVAEFVDNIEIKINPTSDTTFTLIPHDRQGKIFGINEKLYCPAIDIFKKLLDSFTKIYSPHTFGYDEPHPDSSFTKNMKKCESLPVNQTPEEEPESGAVEGAVEEPESQEGGSKSRRRRRHRRKPARKTRRGRNRKSKPKSKTHRRRRIHKNKKYTRKR
jgi:hypothetical protein